MNPSKPQHTPQNISFSVSQRLEMTTKNEFSMTSLLVSGMPEGSPRGRRRQTRARKRDEKEDGAKTANKKTSRETRFALIVMPPPFSISSSAGGYCLWKAIKVFLLLQYRVVSDWLGCFFYSFVLLLILTRKRFALRYWQIVLIDWIHCSGFFFIHLLYMDLNLL